jgi:hypothetical protein
VAVFVNSLCLLHTHADTTVGATVRAYIRLVYGGPNGAEKPLFGNLQGYKCASTTAARTVVADGQSLFE